MYEKYAALRDARGVTDYYVSRNTGIHTSTLCDWKKGRYNPKIDKLKKIADFFSVGIEYFINE